ncbi:MAG: polyribonucleotide nucleotidyltransferase [Elusimicrobiota bacterium]
MIKKEILAGNKKIEFETGKIARQANGSVFVRMGDTCVLATVVMSPEPLSAGDRRDMLPLTIDYRERTYAAGRIPGGFFKREGRPREKETLTSRLIDRTVRPLFPEGFQHKIQINVVVLSSDGENDADVLSLLGVSFALMISDIPFNGPVACARVGRIDGSFVLNPTYTERTKSDLDLFVAGAGDKTVMMEMAGNELQEQDVSAAIEFAGQPVADLCKMQDALQKEAGIKKIPVEKEEADGEIISTISGIVKEHTDEFMDTGAKSEKQGAFNKALDSALVALLPKFPEKGFEIKATFDRIVREEIRKIIFEKRKRPDGRSPADIRDITSEAGALPRVHGSALFTRGQTQSLVAVTLGTPADKQRMEQLEGEYRERFLFHYNFPGFATGDVKPERATSRREIGHGALAKKAIQPLLPGDNEFPYTIRLVSDILESNGSSSMASVCGGSLALFDAGVPMKSAVAGVALGLVKEASGHVILTDLIGFEDHIGDMDFKVAGTKNGITAIQMDLKIDGIDIKLISETLSQAKDARLKILGMMERTIDKPRETLSEHAPKMIILQIQQSKIGGLIGPGGKNIRQIVEETEAKIDIEEDGRVFISSTSAKSIELAKQMVEYYTADVDVGRIYQGKVTRITDFGAFVEILPGKEGLVHISKLADHRVNRVEDVVKEGDEIAVKVMEVDNQGRIVLSKKAAK